jgi:fructose-1-phosphate kinase PfkB-like protein
MFDPVTRAIPNAPIDDEPVTEEERQAVARSEARFEERGGKGIPMEEVLADFGLTIEK